MLLRSRQSLHNIKDVSKSELLAGVEKLAIVTSSRRYRLLTAKKTFQILCHCRRAPKGELSLETSLNFLQISLVLGINLVLAIQCN